MKNKGLTIIELIAVIVILGIISTIAIFTIGNVINASRLKADELSLNSLNSAVSYYNLNNVDEPLDEQNLSEDEIISLLLENSYLSSSPELQSSSASFIWSSEEGVFHIQLEDEILPLSPYGDSFEEIAPRIISDIQENYIDTGKYGRTWGDYRYTDIGLDPDDWDEPILHLYYIPSGSVLRIDIESGYEAIFEKSNGDSYVLPSSLNYSIIYNVLDEQWYYHSINEDNLIDITTFFVRLSD